MAYNLGFGRLLGRGVFRVGQILEESGVFLERSLSLNAIDKSYVRTDKLRGIVSLPDITPVRADNVYVEPGAVLCGTIGINGRTSIWKGAVLRADESSISIGSGSNIQEGAVISCVPGPRTLDNLPSCVMIGDDVTICKGASVTSCIIESNCLIGEGAVVSEGVKVDEYSIVASDAVVEPNTHIHSGEVWAGNPAKCIRHLDDMEFVSFGIIAKAYQHKSDDYRNSESDDALGTPFSPYTMLDDEEVSKKYNNIYHEHTPNMPRNIVYDRMEEEEDIQAQNERKYQKYK